MSVNKYTFSKNIYLDFDEAIDAVIHALKIEGFGVLTDIDVTATIKNKLNIDIEPYRILGVCNPLFVHEAIITDASIGALLPCNVVVRKAHDNGINVEFMDPESVLGIVSDPKITEIGKKVKSKLKRVMNTL